MITAYPIQRAVLGGRAGIQAAFLGAFSPDDIAGLQLWLAASSIAGADGDPVGTWADQSGNGNDATSTLDQRPLLKKGANGIGNENVLLFDGTDDIMTIPFDADVQGPSFTQFIVFEPDAAGVRGIFDNNRGVSWTWYTLGGNLNADGLGGNVIVGAVSSATPYVASRTNGGGAQATWLDGAAGGTNSGAVPGGSADFLIGQLSDGFPFTGKIAEILVYNTVLSTSDREAVEDYLGEKYGISITH